MSEELGRLLVQGVGPHQYQREMSDRLLGGALIGSASARSVPGAPSTPTWAALHFARL